MLGEENISVRKIFLCACREKGEKNVLQVIYFLNKSLFSEKIRAQVYAAA